MSEPGSLQAEVERLRSEVEAYRSREVENLRSLLAQATHAAEHYRAEALRNAEAGRQADALANEKIARLEAQLEVLKKTANAKP